MKNRQREVEELRAGVNCATVLEKATPPWRLDCKQSSRRCLKYRRCAGEIVIVTHGGAVADPKATPRATSSGSSSTSSRPSISARCGRRCGPWPGLPDFTPAERARDKRSAPIPVAQRWARRPRLRQGSDSCAISRAADCLDPC